MLDAEAVLLYVGGSLVAAEPSARVPYETMDASRPLTALSFDGAVARHAGDGAAWERVRDLAVIALAAEQVGGAARCLEAATAHARLRHQFGRPIGSFQAIKHRLAELLVVVESARSAVWGAVGDPSAQAAAIAGSYCGEAYLKAAGDSIQIHGGIGITWEHEAHRYFKRATSDARLFGPPPLAQGAPGDRLTAEQFLPRLPGVGAGAWCRAPRPGARSRASCRPWPFPSGRWPAARSAPPSRRAPRRRGCTTLRR
ncbi:acyl-CoA dehydrogenase family protein [Nonomuraea dietziae]|uniref:acyl-CoA dehydrogenase family protein n=1 Tax=Nonomuraea dietziae TaxID=65515 RepID=UPI0031E01731